MGHIPEEPVKQFFWNVWGIPFLIFGISSFTVALGLGILIGWWLF